MDNTQSNRLDMFKACAKFSDDTSAITSTRQGFVDGITDLKAIINSIEDAAGKQTTETSGSFTDKNSLQEALCQALYLVTSGTKAYAASISNNTLMSQMDYSITDLRRIKDDTIVPFTDNIIALVTPELANTPPFGIAAAQITALNTAKTAYINFENTPRIAVTGISAQTEALPPLFTSGTNILRNVCDPIAVTLKAANPEWFSQWHNVRKIINTGKGTTVLDGQTFDSVSNEGIYNVLVNVPQLSIHTTTDVKGNFKFIPIKRGTYTLTFTHPDYEDLTLDAFEIVQGHTVTKNVAMIAKP